MILAKVLLISLSIAMGSLAFADDPPPPSSTPAAETTSAARATADAASTVAADKATADKAKSAATDAKTTAPGGITPEQAKSLRMAGYKAEGRKGGEVYYCRYTTQIGSRFEGKMCGTPEEILRLTIESHDLTNQLQHSNIPPPAR